MGHEEGHRLWAITTYFNPMRYRARLDNFRYFRRHLKVPLVCVEQYWDAPQLAGGDADRLVHLQGGDVLWQKERLLNVAIQRLPPEAEYVAWLDCDIVFKRHDWAQAAIAALHRHRLVQLFTEMVDLPLGEVSSQDFARHPPSGQAIGGLLQRGAASQGHFTPASTGGMRRALFGLAWAAEVELIRRHGFYDAMIIGSGDRAMVCAALGRPQDAEAAARLSAIRAQHYRGWADPFHADVQGSVGALAGRLLHLWHGEIKDRRYLERHIDFAQLDFDPYADIEVAANGLFRWTDRGQRLIPFMSAYFANRNEGERLDCEPRQAGAE